MLVPRLLSDFYSEYVTHTLMIDLLTSVKSLWEKKKVHNYVLEPTSIIQ